jgi:hypothetical protein
MAEMMASRDPLLVASAVSLATYAGDSERGPAIYVDGQAYGGLSAEQFFLARRLMTCRMTGSCTSRDAELTYQCALEGRCADSIEAGVRADAASSGSFDRISRVADRLLAVVNSADPAPLMQPR